MKKSQKLRVKVENITFIQRFDELDEVILPLVAELERKGDIYGPAVGVVNVPYPVCVTVEYADKRRGPVAKKTIFGQDTERFLSRQYK